MQQIQERYRARGLVVVAVNLDHDRKQADRFLAAFPHDFSVRFDAAGALPTRFKVDVMPTSFLLNANGEVVAMHMGFRSSDEAQYATEIETLLAQSAS